MRAVLCSAALFALLASACGSPTVQVPGGGKQSTNGSGPGSGSGSGGPQLYLPDADPSGVVTGPGAPTDTSNCGVKTLDLKSGPGDLLLLLDRSGSMADPLSGADEKPSPAGGMRAASKWDELVPALDTVITRTQGMIAWGLKLFPLPEACDVPAGVTVPLAFANHDQVMKAITANSPSANGGSTPTRLATSIGAAFLRGTQSSNPKYLLLATDGLPNCAGNGRSHDAGDESGAIKAVADAFAAGIPTFVVGIATAGTSAHDTLNTMAVKGGRPRNDVTKYYSVSSRDELAAALETIAGQIASCTFPLSPAPPVPDNVAVRVDGKPLARDTNQTNGWNYGPGNGVIELFGAACDDLKSGAAKNVQILYGCAGRLVQ